MNSILQWFQNSTPGQFLLAIIALAFFIRFIYEIITDN